MRRTLCGGIVLAALMILVGQPGSDAVAQAKKEKTGKVEVKDKKEAKGSAVIEIKAGKDDKFRFFVRNADGELLAMSGPGGFATAKEAEAAIAELKDAIAKAKVTVVDK